MILNMTGGAGGSGKSEIIVYAPTGSTVTVQRGQETPKTATEVNGVWTFKNCDVGTWVVSASLGNNEWSGEVVIQEEGQLMRYEVTVSYFSATINITYPAGSTCTATDGAENFVAPDTTGTWTLLVPNAGDWIILSTDGTDSAEQRVIITIDGQSEFVTLNYNFYLVENGQKKLTFSNAAIQTGTPKPLTVTEGTDKITLAQTYGSGAQYVTGTVIDITKYSTLKLKCTNIKNPQQTEHISSWIMFGLAKTKNSNWFEGGFSAGKDIPINSNEQILSLDISALTGEFYASIGIYSWYTVSVFEFWLE